MKGKTLSYYADHALEAKPYRSVNTQQRNRESLICSRGDVCAVKSPPGPLRLPLQDLCVSAAAMTLFLLRLFLSLSLSLPPRLPSSACVLATLCDAYTELDWCWCPFLAVCIISAWVLGNETFCGLQYDVLVQ